MGYVSSGCFAEDKIKAAGKVVLKSTKDSNQSLNSSNSQLV